MKTVFASFLSGVALTVGGTQVFGADTTDLINDKNEVYKQYYWAQVRLGEVPTLDLSTVSTEEASAVIAQLATEKDVTNAEQPNLFQALHTKAVAEGLACK